MESLKFFNADKFTQWEFLKFHTLHFFSCKIVKLTGYTTISEFMIQQCLIQCNHSADCNYYTVKNSRLATW